MVLLTCQLEEQTSHLQQDKSGKISTDELRHVLSCIGEPLSDEDIQTLMRAADKDGDGEIDYKEFSSMLAAPK